MRHLFLAVTMLAAPAVAAAQIVAGSIDPGMSRAQVVERLGAPASERSISGFTYLLYENGCERTCGMSDLVTLQGDSVVDAIFRAAERRYTGQSSSPAQGAYGRTRSALAVSREAPDRPAPRRGGAAPASGFALPTEWLAAGGANPASAAAPPATVDSIVLDISALPVASAAPKRTPGKSLLPAEWLSDTAGAPAAAVPSAAAAAPAPPPAAAPRKSSLLPAEWLGDAPAAGAAPAAQAAPPAPAPAKRQSLLPAEWLGETSGAAAPPAKAAPAARPDSTVKKPLIPAEWLTPTPPAGGTPPPRPDSAAARPPAANPFVVSPPATTPPPEA